MASVPAETSASDLPASSEGQNPESGNKMVLGFNRLNLLRQVGLMVGLAASVALGLAVVLWAQEPNYQPVVGDLSSYNPQDVAGILESNNIEYKMNPRTGAVLVPSDKVYDARLKLAAEGVTDRKTIGYELLDQDRGLGTSQFMETITYRRGLEGELARTIASMRGVKNARVHLAIPERSVFIRDAREPSASVFLDLFAGRRPEQEQIRAIVNLVAGSIPMMKREVILPLLHARLGQHIPMEVGQLAHLKVSIGSGRINRVTKLLFQHTLNRALKTLFYRVIHQAMPGFHSAPPGQQTVILDNDG